MALLAVSSRKPRLSRSLTMIDQLNMALRRTFRGRAAHVYAETCDGVIVLRGFVQNYYHKQLASSEASSLAGSGAVRDEIAVV